MPRPEVPSPLVSVCKEPWTGYGGESLKGCWSFFSLTLSSDLYTPATYQLTEEGTFRVVDEKAMEKVSVLFLGSGEGVGSWGVGTKGLGR